MASGTTQNQDSLIRLENSLIARFDSLLGRKKFPVQMRREFPRKLLDMLPYLAPLGGLARPSPSREFLGFQRRVRTRLPAASPLRTCPAPVYRSGSSS